MSPDGEVKATSFWHTAPMPHAAPSASKDPEHYPDNPRADTPAAATCVPSDGQYAPRGVLTLAILWARTTAAGPLQRDIITVELVVGDPKTTHKATLASAAAPAGSRTQAAAASGAAGVALLTRGAEACESEVEARLGPWMLLCVHAAPRVVVLRCVCRGRVAVVVLCVFLPTYLPPRHGVHDSLGLVNALADLSHTRSFARGDRVPAQHVLQHRCQCVPTCTDAVSTRLAVAVCTDGLLTIFMPCCLCINLHCCSLCYDAYSHGSYCNIPVHESPGIVFVRRLNHA